MRYTGPRRRACELFRRRPEGWLLDALAENGWLVLQSINFERGKPTSAGTGYADLSRHWVRRL